MDKIHLAGERMGLATPSLAEVAMAAILVEALAQVDVGAEQVSLVAFALHDYGVQVREEEHVLCALRWPS